MTQNKVRKLGLIFQRRMNILKRTFYVTAMLLTAFTIVPATSKAELQIDSVYPTLGKLGEDLEVSISGSGFDENTRISMSLDSGNRVKIVGSAITPGTANDIAIVNNTAFVADGNDGLQVIDLNNQTQPIIIGSIDMPPSFSGDDDFNQALAVSVVDNIAYIAGRQGGLVIIDVSVLTNPEIIWPADEWDTMEFEQSLGGRMIFWDVCVVDNKAYMANESESNGLVIIDISNPADPTIIGSVDMPYIAYGVAVDEGIAYVADFASGLQIVDLNDPANPAIIGSVDTESAYRVRLIGETAYVADYWGGLKLIDVSDPTNPTIIGSVGIPGLALDVAVADDIAYVTDGKTQAIDISDPSNPMIIGAIETSGSSKSITVAGSSAIIADGNMQVIDISNPPKRSIIGSINTTEAVDLDFVGNTIFIADMLGGQKIIDISDPTTPTRIASFPVPFNTRSYGVSIVGDEAYMANGDRGLQIVDISDPANPTLIGSVDTPSYAHTVKIVDSTAYVADHASGMQVIDISNPTNPTTIGSVKLPVDTEGRIVNAHEIEIIGNMAYVSAWSGSLHIIDISNPRNPAYSGSIDGISSQKVTLAGNKAYVAGGNLYVLDVADPATPEILGFVDTPGSANGVEIIGNIAYVADGGGGVTIIDISDSTRLTVIGSVDTPGSAKDLAIIGSTAYVADSSYGLTIVPVPIEISPLTVTGDTRISGTLPKPFADGNYTLRAFNELEMDEQIGAISFLTPEDWAIQNRKKAIIVAGGGPYEGNSLWDETRLCVNYAYKALQTQGYDKNNVKYLSPEPNTDADGDGAYNDVTAGTSLEELREAITGSWAKEAVEVLVYLSDHGGEGTFQLNDGTILTAEELDEMLDDLQSVMTGKVILIYEACQSGSFIPTLTPPPGRPDDRIIITSSTADEPANFFVNGALSFSYQFWSYLRSNARLSAAMTAGERMMEDWQTVLVDANGNGMPNEDEDYAMAHAVTICRGRVVATTPPEIGWVNSEIQLSGENSATIWANNIVAENGLDKVIAFINPPGFDDAPLDLPVTDYPTVELVGPDAEGKYSAIYNDFGRNGVYNITIIASDKEGLFSLPSKTRANQTAGNTAPLAMASPTGGVYNKKQSVRLIPSEQDATIHYSLTGTATRSSAPYTEAIEVSADTTISFLPVSSAGEEGRIYTESYRIDLSLPGHPVIDPARNTISSFSPYPVFTWVLDSEIDQYILQYADNVSFENAIEITGIRTNTYAISDPLPTYGIWHWRIGGINTAGTQGPWSAFQYEYKEDNAVRKAIVVAGGIADPGNQLWQATETTAKYARDSLLFQGYEADNIRFLSSDPDLYLDGNNLTVDVTASSVENFSESITSWAAGTDELFIFLHGPVHTDLSYQINETENITAAELDTWLDILQTNMEGKVYLLIDTDYSGGMIESLAPPDNRLRIVMASSNQDEKSTFLNSGVLSFSYQFWSSLYYDAMLYDAFVQAKRMLNFNSCQHAQLEADGSGPANDKSDIIISSDIIVGIGRCSGSTAPQIESITEPQAIAGPSNTVIEVQGVTGLNQVERVFAVITPPGYGTPESAAVLDVGELHIVEGTDNYLLEYSGFSQVGIYQISIYAVDVNNLYSLPIATTVDHRPIDAYEEDDTLNQAKVIVLNDTSPHRHNFSDQGDRDCVKFVGIAGQNYVIKTENAGTNCDTVISLFDQNGTTILAVCDDHLAGQGEMLSWTCPANGVYYVRITECFSAFGANTQYDLRIEGPIGGTPTMVHGRVTDSQGFGIEGAIIEFQTTNTAAISIDEGYFSIYIPVGTYMVSVEIHGTSSVVRQEVTVDAESIFNLKIISAGDIDDSGVVDLSDAILALKIVTLQSSALPVSLAADVNGDGKIGLHEASYIIQRVAD